VVEPHRFAVLGDHGQIGDVAFTPRAVLREARGGSEKRGGGRGRSQENAPHATLPKCREVWLSHRCPAPGASDAPPKCLPGTEGKGSSLPHCPGTPLARALAERACDRWIASSIICGVAAVGFGGAVIVGGGLVVGLGVVCAHVAGTHEMTPTSAPISTAA